MKKINRSRKEVERFRKIMGKCKKYSDFSAKRELVYKYTETFGTRVCPYCNINFTCTVRDFDDNPVLRPDLDHFISYASNKAARLDPDNLVPACLNCNMRIKRSKIFNRKTHVHPYYDDFDTMMKFSIYLKKLKYTCSSSYSIIFDEGKHASDGDIKRAKRNISDLKLEERYQYHKLEVDRIFKKIKYYHQNKRNEIASLLGENDLTLISALFPETDKEEINNESLGKLKLDIFDEFFE